MKYLVAFIALIAFTFVSCTQSQAPTEPQTQDNALTKAVSFKDGTIYAFFYNDCCGEWVITEGTLHIVIRNDDFNNIHFDVKGLAGSGYNFVDGEFVPTGHTYTQRGAMIINNSDNGKGTYTGTFQAKLVNQDGCSFTLKGTFHTTTNANGEVTTVVDKYEVVCD